MQKDTAKSLSVTTTGIKSHKSKKISQLNSKLEYPELIGIQEQPKKEGKPASSSGSPRTDSSLEDKKEALKQKEDEAKYTPYKRTTQKNNKMTEIEISMRRIDDTLDSRQSGANGPQGLQRALTPRSKHLKEMYDSVKYKDDEEILPWQRQLKVNRFMADLQVRKHIEELVEPIVKTQTKIKYQLDNSFIKHFEDQKYRMKLLEQTVFGMDGPDFRFEKIEKAQLELDTTQKQHYAHHNGQRDIEMQKIDDHCFQVNQRLQKVEMFEAEAARLTERQSKLEIRQDKELLELKSEHNTFLATNRKQINENVIKIQKFSRELYEITDRMNKADKIHKDMLTYRTETDKQMIAIKQEMSPLQEKKLDVSQFNAYNQTLNTNVSYLREEVEKMVSEVTTNSNYLQKYVPIQTQRAITHVLGYVFNQKEVSWRLNWYNELRMPMLSAALLNDMGQNNLKVKMGELIDMIQSNPMTVMEINVDQKTVQNKTDLLKDEQLLSNTLNSRKLHAKAKILIFDSLDELERKRAQAGKDHQDMHDLEVDFGEIQDKLFQLLQHEDPLEAKKLGVKSLQEEDNGKLGVGALDDDEEDNGLDNQVTAIIERFYEEHNKRLQIRLKEIQQDLESNFNKQLQSQSDQFKQDNHKLEETIHMVHLAQINDVQSMKGIHKQFNRAQERLDSKTSMIVNLEKAYQQILQHVKNSSLIVDSLIQLNLQQEAAASSGQADFQQAADNAQEIARQSLVLMDEAEQQQLNQKSSDQVPMVVMNSSSVVTSAARRAFNLNPLAFDSSPREIERTQTQLQEHSEMLDKSMTENLMIESQKIGELDGLSDYNQSKLKHIKQHKAAKMQHVKDATTAGESDVNSNSGGSNGSNSEFMNLHNYFNQFGSQQIGKQSLSSAQNAKNQAFIQKKGGHSRFKQYHLGTSTLLSPKNNPNDSTTQIRTSANEINNDQHQLHQILSPQDVPESFESRPKSQAAGFNQRIKRNSNLVQSNAQINMLRNKSGNMIGRYDIGALAKSSETSIIDRANDAHMNVHGDRARIQTQQSSRTTQNNLTRGGRSCAKHIQSSFKGGRISTNNVRLSQDIQNSHRQSFHKKSKFNHSNQNNQYGAETRKNGGRNNTAAASFDRGQAISKLVQLGADARKLAIKLDSLVMAPVDEQAMEAEKGIQKKIKNHKQALNMLPNAQQFKSELHQFQKRLDTQSKAQKHIESHNGFLEEPRLMELKFSKPGIELNFGINHSNKKRNEVKPKDEETLQDLIAKHERKYTPNRLSSEQEFGQISCALQQQQPQVSRLVKSHYYQQHQQSQKQKQLIQKQDSQQQKVKVTEADSTLTDAFNSEHKHIEEQFSPKSTLSGTVQQTGHIFCKHEVLNSVSRVL